MRVMVFVPGNADSEANKMPPEESIAKMLKFNEELVKAGVMLAADGLAPTSRSKKVRFSGAERTVIDGPFAESKELVAGFWIWQVKSMEEAVEWLSARRSTAASRSPSGRCRTSVTSGRCRRSSRPRGAACAPRSSGSASSSRRQRRWPMPRAARSRRSGGSSPLG